MSTSTRGSRLVLRWFLAICCMTILFVTLWQALLEKSRVDVLKSQFPSIPPTYFNDVTKGELDISVQRSKARFDLCLLLLGALWALVISKKGEARLALGPEVLMFSAASLLLLLSLAWHDFYLENLGDAYGLSIVQCGKGKDSPCFLNTSALPEVTYLLSFQTKFLIAGGLAGVITIASAARLRG
jgi:hypothetical protein